MTARNKQSSSATASRRGSLRRALAASTLAICLAALTFGEVWAEPTSAENTDQRIDTSDQALVNRLPGFANGYAEVNGIRLHFVEGGSGQPLFLLGGWGQTWWQFHKIMPELAKQFRVIAVDIRGQGTSSKPASGYDKKTMAGDIHALAHHLGYKRIHVVGQDIGAMVAYSFAANYPDDTQSVALLDVPHPFEGYQQISILPPPGAYDLSNPNHPPHPWWFAFHQVPDLPEKLLHGRMDILLNWMFDYLAKDKTAISPFDRTVYIAAYEAPEAISAGHRWYQTFGQDIEDLRHYGKLKTPVLGLGGLSYSFLATFLSQYVENATLIELKDAGHWLTEERPEETTAALAGFLQQLHHR
jgi:pimeloyl-ACP methyl ester carboxylesterase